MTSQESLNSLIGNFVSIPSESSVIIENNMICFDTSYGYLGFNTIDPSYEIDVSGGTIKTYKLILNNLPNEDNTGLVVGSVYQDSSGYLRIVR